jgi:hypothetical protein
MLWAKNGKVGKGTMGTEVYSADNQLLV